MKRAMFGDIKGIIFGRWWSVWLLGAWMGLLSRDSTLGQIAITEVMSWASTNRAGVWVPNQSDYFELTNYGGTALDLAGYTFSDRLEVPRLPLISADAGRTESVLGAGESWVFVRFRETTNSQQFLEWWGTTLDPRKVIFYPAAIGFDSDRDGVRIWNPQGVLVEQVDFGRAQRGVAFVSDGETGQFGVLSELGVCGAVRAVGADDVGSPGVACGAIALRLLEQPAEQVSCVGGSAVFRVRAVGLPRPRYQWFFGEKEIPGATESAYEANDLRAADTGRYRVRIDNGLETIWSSWAELVVTTSPSSPEIQGAPEDAEVFVRQTARFSVKACGFPAPTYQWRSNGVPLLGETRRVLELADCPQSASGARFDVVISNGLGTVVTGAILTVTPRAKLHLSEMMVSASTNCLGTGDWLELTNRDTFPIQLRGYRFSDRLNLSSAIVITQSVVLLPGKSAVFVERSSLESFREWWGAENLPLGMVVIPYAGLGFSERGDQFYLWNPGARTSDDWLESRVFAGGMLGVSLRFGRDENDECYFGCESVEGENGAFRATNCGDIGSPGYSGATGPVLLMPRNSGGRLELRWRGSEGRRYRVERSRGFVEGPWQPIGEVVAEDAFPKYVESDAGAPGGGYYRVVQIL